MVRPEATYAGALAGAFLVAVIGLPFVWTSFDPYSADRARDRPPGVEARASEPVMADTDLSAADSAPPGPGSKAPEEVPAAAPTQSLRIDPSQARKAAEAPAGRSEEPSADSSAQESGEVVVTGSRIRNPNLESSVPVTSIGSDEITLTGSRAAKAARRGDWNACTIEDPGRSLARCRRSVDPAARGARGRTATQLADGLSNAWNGDLEGATAAFDRAIELAPQSSDAYLNRGLAWRRLGDLDRALADLDRAVRYGPREARAYYHRSVVLRQRGDLRRARADEESAVALDHRYAPLVGGR